MKRISLFISVILLNFCTPPVSTLSVIMFDNNPYPSTNAQDILVYVSRLELPLKFIEIGTIKFDYPPFIEEVKTLAATKGADALIKDHKNYILIKYKKEKEEKTNEYKTI